MDLCGIYGFRNSVNGCWYVGQSLHINRRRQAHLARLRRGAHRNAHFQASFKKYGEDTFEFHVLEQVAENMLDIRETAWIGYYRSNERKFGYNCDSGGNRGRTFSKETIARLSESHKGIKHSVAAKRKIARARRHRAPASTETCRKISESKLGKKHSQETRDKMAKSQQARWLKKSNPSDQRP